MTDLDYVEHIAGVCATSNTAAELCRKLVHSEVTGQHALGAVVYVVTQAGDLELVGSYGKMPNLGDDVSIWANNPVANAVVGVEAKSAMMANHDGKEYLVSAIPITKGGSPIGVAAVVRQEGGVSLASKMSPVSIRALGNIYGTWLETLGIKPNTGPITQVSDAELTSRQIEIIKQIASGNTNAQIAANLILSESSIRQETVRIYRALGVGARSEAARKALNLGIIEKTVI